MVELRREYADTIGYPEVVYDALLDDYEPGIQTAQVKEILARLREGLVPLAEKILGSERKPDTAILRRDFPVDRQRFFVESAASAIGFDLQTGRLDTTTHPFCTTLGPKDCRITTRYVENEFVAAFFDVMHEAGHGIYAQGLPAEHFGTPLAWEAGLGVHESQSRLWENFVARSHGFWRHFFPRAQQAFPIALGGVALDDFYFAVNDVRASLIRIDADEVTYNLHILIRFEIEQAVFGGDLSVADLPEAFNEKMRSYLGIVPENDTEGCLQDVHWAEGVFGYFPTYSLGNIYAAQLYAAAGKDLGDLQAQFAAGDFQPLLSWLREKIHRHGRRYLPFDLITRATGQEPDPEYLLDYLDSKYSPLYFV
jgi:carboxypeptidase Taq